MRLVAGLIFVVGLLIGCAALARDVSVVTAFGDRVVNLDLMEERRILLWVAGGAIAFAVILDRGVTRQRRHRELLAALREKAAAMPQPSVDPKNAWFYRLMGDDIGPISTDQLVTLAEKGTVTPDTLVKKGGSDWVAAGKVRGLFDVPPLGL
jgi:hypothetical protein